MRLSAFLTTLPSPTNRVLKAHGRWFAEEQEIPYREEIVARFRIPEIGRCRLRNVPQRSSFHWTWNLRKNWMINTKSEAVGWKNFFQSPICFQKATQFNESPNIWHLVIRESHNRQADGSLGALESANRCFIRVPNTSCGESKHKKAVKPSHWALFVLVKLVAWDRHCCTPS